LRARQGFGRQEGQKCKEARREMRHFRTVFTLAFLISAAGSLIFAEVLKVRVTASQANIRLKPTTQSEAISKVPIGAVLDVIKKEGEWYLVKLPPDEKGIVVTGYIHQSIVEVVEEIKEIPKEEKPEKAKPKEIGPPTILEREVKEEKPMPTKPQYIPRRKREPQKAFVFKSGAGIAFPSGDWSDLFTIGLGANISGSYSILQQPQLSLIGGIEGLYFFRESGYVDISMSRLLVYGDCRFGKKINSFGFFAEGGLGLYLDILEVDVWWWSATESEFEIGARVGGGISFGNLELMAMYHLVERNMFTIMLSYGF